MNSEIQIENKKTMQWRMKMRLLTLSTSKTPEQFRSPSTQSRKKLQR